MRPVSEDFLATVATSHERITEVNVWSRGRIVAADIPVTAGGIAFDEDADMTRMSEGLQVASRDNALTPLTTDAPLAPYGNRIEVRAGAIVAGERHLVRLGWLLLSSSGTSEQYYRDGEGEMQRSPAVVEVEADDLMQVIAEAGFLAPEQPAAGGTCLSEIRRLVGHRLPCAAFTGVTDAAVPATLTYDTGEGGRLKAIQGLAAAVDARCVINDDGYFTVVPRARKKTPVLTLRTAGVDEAAPGEVVSIKRKMSRERVYNAVVARGEANTDAAPVQGVAFDTVSPARWDAAGFGEKPYSFASPLLMSQSSVDAAAATRLNNLVAGRDYTVSVDVIPNPAVEVGDCVKLLTPFEQFVGTVSSLRFPLAGGPMRVALSVLVGDIARVSRRMVLS